MTRISLVLFLLALTNVMTAQIKAVTETGDEVWLYTDGTWKYVNEDISKFAVIQENPAKFEKDQGSTFLVKSTILNMGVWIKTSDWSFKKGEDGETAEYYFQRKGEDLYAMMISEKIPIPIDNLKTIALENAKKAAPDVKVEKEEYRNVNGIKVLMMKMSGTIQGIRFTYYGYYYSNDSGSLQFISYTGESLFKKYKTDIEKLLNGLVEL